MGKRSRDINIVHFSFLDVLFNTIGAIVFIFLIYAVMTNDLVEERNTARQELNKEITKIKEAKEDLKKVQTNEKEAKKELEKTKEEIKKSQQELDKAQSEITVQKVKLKSKDKTIKQLKKIVSTLDKGTGMDTKLNPAQMAEWGESGGSEATKISGKLMGENTESALVNVTPTGFSISGNDVSTSAQLNRWIKYFDPQNQKLEFISSLDSPQKMQEFNNLLNENKAQQGTSLKSLPDTAYPSKLNEKGEFGSDTNADGKVDTIWYDPGKDGKPQKMKKDINGDEKFDEVYLNYDPPTKLWKTKLADVNGDGMMDTAFMDSDLKNQNYEIKMTDFNPKTGKARAKYEDKNNDGIYDVKYVDTQNDDEDWEEVYSDMDKATKKWTSVAMDTNNDGMPDVTLKDTDPSNDVFEEKMVDTDFDGTFDSRWMDLEPNDSDWEAEYRGQDEKSGFWKEVFFDTNADGKWDVHGINTLLKNDSFNLLMKDENNDGKYEVKMEDANNDGAYELRYEDHNNDGKYEKTLTLDPNTEEYIEKK